MKWLLLSLFILFPVSGFCWTPIYQRHDSTEKTDQEFSNQENDLQSQQFKVVSATPSLLDLKDGEIVIVSSSPTSYVKIMFRQNQEIYMINVSCVTVKR